jgi:transcription antitermination factor NusG
LQEAELSDCFLVRTQHRRERWAAENCFREGYGFYLPEITETIRVTKSGQRRREFRSVPLFPGYLFVSAVSGRWHTLLSTFGILALVTTAGGGPAIVRLPELLRIKALEGDGGRVRLPKHFSHNSNVRITAGAYAGYTGLVQGMTPNERVSVLLEYMGRKVPFLVREGDLELVA